MREHRPNTPPPGALTGQNDGPLCPSASVVLVRDGAPGLEVLLLRRSAQSRVHAGMYVFPGGKLDNSDCAPDWLAVLDQDLDTLHQRLAEADTPPLTALGLHLAALRETAEECGVWLLEPPDAKAPAGTLPACAHTMAQAGQRWHSQALLPWSRWITPRHTALRGPRFDTRFFLARLPAGQHAMHDAHEAVDSLWVTPRVALERYQAQTLDLLPPQLMALAQLARHPNVASAWSQAAQCPPPLVLPERFEQDGQAGMCYPGDPLHPVTQRALPGPTRLRVVRGRFEPFDGFQGWFA